jgi:hypothetical protein
MSLLSKLLGKHHEPLPTLTTPATCVHAVLRPRWDNAEDMGHEDKATSYQCEACSEVLTAEAAQAMKAATNAPVL